MAREDQNQDKEPEGRDWGEVLVKAASALGFNETRMRWKVQIWRRRMTRTKRRTDHTARHIKYSHKLCPRCGQLNDQEETLCTACNEDLAGHRVDQLHRVGVSLPRSLSVSGALGVAMVLVYARLILAEWPDPGILELKVETLYRFGGHWTPAVQAGQYWRWLTCIFLHAGLWHIGFNLFALSQIGPAVEQVFGRGRTVMLFIFTGLCGSVVSHLWGLGGVGIGASGAVMGLCGVAGGWGHRQGTTMGREIRTMMIKWAAYTILFGIFIGADNAAHIGGFVSGGIIGFALQPLLGRTRRKSVAVLEALLGGGAVLAGVLLCLFPPAPPGGSLMDSLGMPNPYQQVVTTCRYMEQGQQDMALEKMQSGQHDRQVTAADLQAMCEQVSAMIARCREQPDKGSTGAASDPASQESPRVCSWILQAADSGD